MGRTCAIECKLSRFALADAVEHCNAQLSSRMGYFPNSIPCFGLVLRSTPSRTSKSLHSEMKKNFRIVVSLRYIALLARHRVHNRSSFQLHEPVTQMRGRPTKSTWAWGPGVYMVFVPRSFDRLATSNCGCWCWPRHDWWTSFPRVTRVGQFLMNQIAVRQIWWPSCIKTELKMRPALFNVYAFV